jgi:signal peptidase I
MTADIETVPEQDALPYAQLVPKRQRRWARFRSADESALLRERTPMPWSLRILFTIIVVAVLSSTGWQLSGGALYSVATTSMCSHMCVGELLLDRPLVGKVHVGEVVTFTPPGLTMVYSHRVVKVLANGSFKTKGDATKLVDPWTVYPSQVEGVVVASIWGAGWLSKALPFLALGMLAILFLRRRIPVLIRREWDRLFATLIVLVPVWMLKPLIRGVLISSVTARKGVGRVGVVNTGLLPAQFKAVQGQFKDFVSSGHAIVLTGKFQPDHQVHIVEFASFHWQGWTVVYLIVFSPLLAYFYRARRLRRLGLRRISENQVRSAV